MPCHRPNALFRTTLQHSNSAHSASGVGLSNEGDAYDAIYEHEHEIASVQKHELMMAAVLLDGGSPLEASQINETTAKLLKYSTRHIVRALLPWDSRWAHAIPLAVRKGGARVHTPHNNPEPQTQPTTQPNDKFFRHTTNRFSSRYLWCVVSLMTAPWTTRNCQCRFRTTTPTSRGSCRRSCGGTAGRYRGGGNAHADSTAIASTMTTTTLWSLARRI